MYELEIPKLIEEIKSKKARLVCLHLPDGLKPMADGMVKAIESNTEAKAIIWGGSCYGSCDLPMNVKDLGVDLLIHYGHSAWQDAGKREYGKII